MKSAGWVALALVLAVVVPTRAAHTAIVDVVTAGDAFAPNRVTINVGDSIRWSIAIRHNVVETTDDTNCISKPGGFMSGSADTDLSVREYTQVFHEVGVYTYMCTPHCQDGMVGQVEVVLPGEEGADGGSAADSGGCLNAARAGPTAMLGFLLCLRSIGRRRRR